MEHFNLKRRVAEWSNWHKDLPELARMIEHQMTNSPKLSLQPFQAETYPIPNDLVRRIAVHFSSYAARRAGMMLETLLGPHGSFSLDGGSFWPAPTTALQVPRLKIGYISSDFRQHPLSYLIQNLFQLHDANGFEIYCYATTPSDGSQFRSKIAAECQHFHEVYMLPDVEMAAMANQHNINILIDLNGYTAGGKTEVFAMHPAPVQVLPGVSYFGSMGSPAMHSYISDRVGTPPETACTYSEAALHCLYSEKMLYMPNSYQLNDHKQSHHAVVESPPQPRAEITASGPLPEGAFVYVNFNSYQKIEPELFKAWCSIVSQVPGSILWVLQYPPDGERRLRATWRAAGLADERLVTAPLTDPRSNLMRMGAADLHLDTLLFNGHTTTTDSLWAGVPVITKPGERHASRVASSSSRLFSDVPHMSVPTLEAYVQHAVALGRNRKAAARLKEAMREQRIDSPLFDTQRWVRDWERGARMLWDTFTSTGKIESHVSIAE